MCEIIKPYIIPILIVISIISIIYFFYYQNNQIVNNIPINSTTEQHSNKLMMTVYKSGGIMGMVYRMEIDNDKSYRLFDHDKLKKEGKLDATTMNSAIYLVDKFPQLNNSYCEFDGFDGIFHTLNIGNRNVSLGTLSNSTDKCLPDDIYHNYDNINKMMAWQYNDSD